jgi:hypothetical protein
LGYEHGLEWIVNWVLVIEIGEGEYCCCYGFEGLIMAEGCDCIDE